MDKSLIEFLELLDTEMARNMLADLKDDDKRSPQLYNAIGKLLERHKFQISKLQPDAHVLGGLSEGLEAYNEMTGGTGLTDEDIYAH